MNYQKSFKYMIDRGRYIFREGKHVHIAGDEA